MSRLDDRLNAIKNRIQDAEFLANNNIGNEIGFYIFDYPPEEEMTVRNGIALIEKHFEKSGELQIKEINLFDIITGILASRNLLDKREQFERKLQARQLKSKLKPVVSVDAVVDKMTENIDNADDVIFMTGVGSAYPLIRTHNVLDNLQDKLGKQPLIVFFPGNYNMRELVLFGLLDKNYYRAFRLID